MASSSTSLVKKSYEFDVFLSFSGEDTRKNFVDHLYDALQQHGIHTFKDDERLKKGNSINDQLLKSIEDSKVFIIVFSKNYASSSWCLNELVKIIECQKSKEQIAYPVFYNVDPSQVRKQSGPVGEAFAKHTIGETGKWREALTEAANLSGWDLRNTADGHEAKVIKLIVERISLELRSINVNLDDKLVGMEPRLQDLEKSLDISSEDVRMIGIKGMGGAGKTTLARATFDRLSSHFEAKSFVENVREVSKQSSGLLSLQRMILSDLLNSQGNNVSSVHEGTNMMKTKLRGRKVLLVLDDVDNKDQLEALAGDLNWFKPGSRIIITTRDEQVLISHKVKWIRDVNLLSDEEAISLFSRYAFGKDIPIQEYEMQSREVVRYAAGLPLTIKVLGSFLCGKDKPEWIDALARLNTIPLKETLEKLELSYESLEDDYKEIFLDIACLLKGWEKNKAIRMLDSCGFHARNGLRVLEQRSLITFNCRPFESAYGFRVLEHFHLSMHDHIEEMGKNIVRRLHPDEPNKHSRLWIKEEIEDVLDNDLGSEATRCIINKLSRDIVLEGLGNMKKLRCLVVKYGDNDKGCADVVNPYPHKEVTPNLVNTEEVGQGFPNALRYLRCHHYPYWCLPKTFLASNLVALKMHKSKIKQLWVGGKVLKKLKYIELCHSKLRTLDLGLTPNLEHLDLGYSHDLVELHGSGCFKKLVHLYLNGCERLKSFSFIKELKSLTNLDLSFTGLKELPDIIPSHPNTSLELFNFCDNNIEDLPSSIGNLQKLGQLSLTNCTKLKSLPGSICSLQHLRVLHLERCGIEELPKDIGRLESLEELDLSSTKIKHLPTSIGMLKHLMTLHLTSCKIREIPSSICKLKNLETLILQGCEVRKLPEDFGQMESLTKLSLRFSSIREIPSSICKLKHLKELDLSVCYELKKLPENLGDLECLKHLNLMRTSIDYLPHSISLLKGLEIFGYRKRISSDALLLQEQHMTNAPKRRITNIQAPTCDAGDKVKE